MQNNVKREGSTVVVKAPRALSVGAGGRDAETGTGSPRGWEVEVA